jgi:hypothetical protein
MTKSLGWFLFAAFSITLLINGVCMLFAPKTWLRLPDWFPSAGTFFRERYAGEKGLIGIRMTGAVLLAGIAWVVYDFLLH